MALCAITDFNCHCQSLEALIRHPGAKATAIPVVVLLPLPLMLLPGTLKKKTNSGLGLHRSSSTNVAQISNAARNQQAKGGAAADSGTGTKKIPANQQPSKQNQAQLCPEQKQVYGITFIGSAGSGLTIPREFL